MSAAQGRKRLNRRTVNIFFTIFIFIVLAVAFAMTFTLNATAAQVPRLISGLGMFLAVIELIRQIRLLLKRAPDENLPDTTGLQWYYSMLLVAGYVCLLFITGFVITTLIYLALIPMLLGYRKIKVNIIFSIVATAILYLSFTYVFLVQLPSGLISSIFGG